MANCNVEYFDAKTNVLNCSLLCLNLQERQLQITSTQYSSVETLMMRDNINDEDFNLKTTSSDEEDDQLDDQIKKSIREYNHQRVANDRWEINKEFEDF